MSVHVPRWRAPLGSSSKITLPPGKTVPQFENSRFGSGFKENLKKDPAFGPSQAIALAVHAGAIILILSPLHRLSKVTQPPFLRTDLITPDISPYGFKLPPGDDKAGGGGGGGDHSPLPATRGRAPKFTVILMTPPAIPRITNPILVAEASLLGPPELQFPSPNLNNY